MRTSIMTTALGLLALLGSSAGMAATVYMSASLTNDPATSTASLIVNPGQTFYVFIRADVPNTFAATPGLAFNRSVVSYVTGAGLAPWIFIRAVPLSASSFDVERPSATGANPGVYDVAVLRFSAFAGGAANIVINDDGGNTTGWYDATTAEYIPTSYINANIVVTPIPPAVWLFGSALGVMGVMRRKLAS
jgi:hypothetical protein